MTAGFEDYEKGYRKGHIKGFSNAITLCLKIINAPGTKQHVIEYIKAHYKNLEK